MPLNMVIDEFQKKKKVCSSMKPIKASYDMIKTLKRIICFTEKNRVNIEKKPIKANLMICKSLML